MDTSILLKGGVAIIHDEKDQAIPSRLDVLVRGNKIYQISEDIDPPSGAQVIDCKNKIIAPGFIDTHRHMYTIGLRGRHGDNLLEDYMVEGEPQINLILFLRLISGRYSSGLEFRP